MPVLGPNSSVVLGFACVLLECTFSVAHFSSFSRVALQNIYVPKLMENVS